MLEVRLLGQFAIQYGDKTVSITSRPAQSLFAFLILNAGKAYRREKLAGQLWPDSTEEQARDYLRHALWRIRKALQAASSTSYLQADDLTVAFDLSSKYWLDAAALQDAEEAGPVARLADAISGYEGELLPGFYDEWTVLEREHLQAIYERKLGCLLDLLNQAGRWREVLEWAEKWIALGKKPEAAFRYLMSAHAAQGDMFKVAATYERCMKSLKEFGVEPSEQTRAMYERLKSGKGILSSSPDDLVSEKLGESARSNLPVPLTSFVGRKKEVEQLVTLLDKHRLVTLTGPGGVGKTRLAIQSSTQVLDKFKDGVWWIELAPLTDETLVPQAIAQVLRVRENPGESVVESVTSFLGKRQLLLVLDNCEHVLNACTQFSHRVLVQCANLKILTTSREPLDIMGEFEYQLQPLSLPAPDRRALVDLLLEYESILLFFERAKAKSGFTLTEQNAAAVLQICQRLDGIPLALELAAARTRMLTVEQIAERLNDRFNLLTQGNRTALARHQTLRASIEWSDELLYEPERILWRRLTVFIGGWTLLEANSVCADEVLQQKQVLELLSQLVDKSLVLVEEQHGTARYHMLETIRQYGQEKLMSSGEDARIRKRYLAYFLDLAEQARSRLLTIDQEKWFSELDSEYGNLRSALEWAMDFETASALRLTVALAQYWEVRGHIGEGRTAIERALKQAQQVPKEVHADGLQWNAKFAARQGDYARAKELLEGGQEISRRLGDTWGIARSLHNSGMVFTLQGDHAAARNSYEASLDLFRELGDQRECAAVATSLGNVANYIGDYETAQKYQEESLAIFRALGDKYGLFIALNNLGVVLERQGNNSAAQRYYEESIATAHELGEKNLVAYALNGLAHVLYSQDDSSGANRNYRESLFISREIGERRCVAYCIEGFAKLASHHGNPRRAAQLLGVAEALRQTIGAPLIQAEQEEFDQDIISTRSQLGEQAYQAAWAEGRAMMLEQAISYALDEK